jgi:RES domain
MARRQAQPPAKASPKTRSVAPQTWWRVHSFNPLTGVYGPLAFNDSAKAQARFSPLVDAKGAVIPAIYAAQSLEGALMESVLHNVPFPSRGYQHDFKRDREGTYHVSQVRTTAALTLVDLTTPGLQAMGLRPSDLFESNPRDYPRTQRWAEWFRQQCAAAQGLYWVSRRYNEAVVMVLYKDRVPARVLKEVAAPRHVHRYESTTLDLVDRLGGSAKPEV